MSSEEDPDVKEIIMAAKLQYGGDRGHHIARRMSGMPLLHRTERCFVKLTLQEKISLNEVLDKFPLPPTNNQPAGSSAVTSSKGSSGSWGTIRGFAEKFSIFSKT